MAARTPEERLMLRAVALSRRGFPAPNPRVGCVLARGSQIVGEGCHDHAGGPHAEAAALSAAGSGARGCDAYVTLEPCNHHGRTPPCARALIEAGVARAWVAVRDPNPVAAGGLEALADAGVHVHVGLCADQAEQVNRVFLTAMRRGSPYVAVKLATTMDGFVARSDGTSKWITGPEARREGHRLRAELGAVLVGRRTVELDQPRLTARIPGVVNQPVRIVLDGSGALTGRGLPFEQSGVTHWFVAGDAAQGRGTVRLLGHAVMLDPAAILGELWERGVRAVLIEGGPQTIELFVVRGLVDRVDWFIAPKVFGEGIRGWRAPFPEGEEGLRLASTSQFGDDALLVFEQFRIKSGNLEPS